MQCARIWATRGIRPALRGSVNVAIGTDDVVCWARVGVFVRRGMAVGEADVAAGSFRVCRDSGEGGAGG